MNSLTESEITQIAELQRDAGIQRLSRHFLWSEFCDERRHFHQEFVYDVTLFAANLGFSWTDVIQSAELAKGIFPQLDDLNVDKLLSLLRDVLYEHLPNLTPVHQHEFTQYLADTCITRRRLFQAVVHGDANMSVVQLHLEGTELQERETQPQLETGLASALQQKEEELRHLRDGARITLGDISVPEDKHLDTQRALELIRAAAVQASESQIVASLTQEAALLTEILQLKLQQEAVATRGHCSTPPTNTGDVSSQRSSKSKVTPVKSKTGEKSGNPV
ncbi:uncharacterized protein C8orf74 homolog isoform X2 [Melanotaenia boesemani]|uniref:uncharacterized protein C8orf74 homolog isoform X2 n=1 Tax=Melanotaenia boesemani TaxID=1250792 RepID=UPI001C03D38E|nr:uncharacterized protein C8orf74 homolog isoform X2 [Melanotaenia boesemani]